MKLHKGFMVALLSVSAMSAMSETEYGYDPSDAKIYIATVPAGETNALTEAAAGVLNGGGVTNFVKRGEGLLVSNRDITSYTGGIVIENGIFRSEPNVQANDTVGKLSGGGDIWVLDGATMELRSPGMYSTHMTGKTTHIAGRGFGGRGALVGCSDNKNQAGATFGTTIKLEADALVCNEAGSGVWCLLACNGCTVDFNSKTLHVGGAGDVGFHDVPTLKNMPNPGTAIVSEGYGVRFQRQNKGTWNLWHTYCGIELKESSRLLMNSVFASNFGWPITMQRGSGIHVRETAGTWAVNTSYNIITGDEKIYLNDSDRNFIQFNNATDFLFIKRRITGGGLQVKTYTAGAGLYLSNRNNDFTNGIVATSCSINILTNGAVPAAGAALSLTNAYAVFHSSEAYSLPPLNAYGNCAVTNYVGFSPSGAWREAVTKTGTGTLRYATLVGAPCLDVRGGTVKLESVGGALPVFGKLGGTRNGTIDFGGNAYSISGISGSPCVTGCPTLTVASSWAIDAASLEDFGGGLATDGALAFSDGVVISVENCGAVGRRQRSWVLATAADGITGMLGCIGSVNGWSVQKSADGKTLSLVSPPAGFKCIIR